MLCTPVLYISVVTLNTRHQQNNRTGSMETDYISDIMLVAGKMEQIRLKKSTLRKHIFETLSDMIEHTK